MLKAHFCFKLFLSTIIPHNTMIINDKTPRGSKQLVKKSSSFTNFKQKFHLNIQEISRFRKLTVVSVTGPGTGFLGHGEQSVGDVRQKAVQVKHMGLYWGNFRLLGQMTGPSVQLGLAGLPLEHNRHKFKTLNDKWKKN